MGEAGGGTSVVKIKELKYASGEWTAKINDTDEEIECEDFMGFLGSPDDFTGGDGLKGFALKPSEDEETEAYAIINAWSDSIGTDDSQYPLLHLNYTAISNYEDGGQHISAKAKRTDL